MLIISFKQEGKVKQERIESYKFVGGMVKCIINEQTGFTFKAKDFVSVVEADLCNPQLLKYGDWYQFRATSQSAWSLPLMCARPHLDWPKWQYRKIPKPQ